jgi:NTP pyrophosphatase (non-canonical NTP hydrolase)
MESFESLRRRLAKAVEELRWQVYHTPENLTLFLVGEAGELAEYAQWMGREELRDRLDEFKEELADVVKNALYLSNVLPLPTSLEKLIITKLELDEHEYPVPEFRGAHRYQVYAQERRKSPVPALPRDRLDDFPTICSLQSAAWGFVTDREWEQFYTPASLSLAICVKCSSIATCYQRRPKADRRAFERAVWAVADVLINAMRISEFMGIKDLHAVVYRKLKDDRSRFRER